MKSCSTMLAVAATALLASCGSEESDNPASNVQADNAGAGNAMLAENAAVPAEDAAAPAEATMPVPGSNVREKEAYRERPRTAPPPGPTPEPEPDPHAGHDMNNMSH